MLFGGIADIILVIAAIFLFWGIAKRSLNTTETIVHTGLNIIDEAAAVGNKKIKVFAKAQEVADQTEMQKLAKSLDELDEWIEVEDLDAKIQVKRPKFK